MRCRSDSDAIRDAASYYLTPSIEAKPPCHSCPLLSDGVPLGREKREPRANCRLEDSQEKPHGNCAPEVFHGSQATEGEAPYYDIESRILCQRKSLKKAVCWPLPKEISEVEDRGDPLFTKVSNDFTSKEEP